MDSNRKFLQFFDSEDYEKVVPQSDEKKKIKPPLFQQPFPEDVKLIDLIPPDEFKIGKIPFLDLVNNRKSRRKFTDESLSLEELSFLLWSTQGVKRILKSGLGVFRTVPSSGAKSPFETYLVVNRVEGLDPGLYRYISFSHQLMFIKQIDDAEKTISELAYNQNFVGKASIIFYWIAVPYRTEWRYTILSHKFIAIDLGIVCQNLYMACEAINLGTVAVGYYEQNKLDKLLELNTEEEFVVLHAPVGKYVKDKKLSEFFKYPKKEAKLEDMKKLTGKYKRKNEIEFVIKNENLVIKVGEFEEILESYNDVEFIGEFSARAYRFELSEKGRPEKLVILSLEDEIKEFKYLE